MANRPGALCTLNRGESIYNQPNFVDTFNWVVACVKNLQGGSNCKVEWTADDTPTINVNDDTQPNGGGSEGGGGVVSITGTVQEDGSYKLEWTYADGTTDEFTWSGGGYGSGVVSINGSVQSDGSYKLEWTYADGTTGDFSWSGGSGGVTSLNTLSGDVTLVSEDDSNVKFTTEGNQIKVGVYYV